MPSRIISATGHRPDKLTHFGPAYSPTQLSSLTSLAESWLSGSLSHISTVISGMALGWDTAVAQAALSLKLPLICAIPFPLQPSRWSPESIALWRAIQTRATAVHIISPQYSPSAMQRRNIWMVNNSTEVLALWNGSRGGTYNCLQFAAQVGKPVTNLWSFQPPKSPNNGAI